MTPPLVTPGRELTPVEVDVFITHIPTGEQRVYHTTDYEVGGVWSDYSWSEGNYACDCNRHLFFERAAGAETETIEHHACGSDEFRIDRVVRVSDGTTLYAEDRRP